MSLSLTLLAVHLALPAHLVRPAKTCVETPSASSASSALKAVAVQPPDSTLTALYEAGITFDTFLANARARRELWVRNWEQGIVPADALAQATALPGRWKLLAVAVDACSDSVNTIPFLARLVAAVPTIELRIISPEAGRALMEARRTPDGRAATPTVILLDAAGNDVGCWVERPVALQAMVQDGKLSSFAGGKQGWYDTDAGASTIREVVALLAEAAAGRPRCGMPPATTPSGTID